MNKKFKFLLLPLALIVSLVFLAACQDDPTDDPVPPTPPTEVSDSESDDPTEPTEAVRDLGGREFVIANWWADFDTDYYEPANAHRRAVLEWRQYIEQRYNFRMREVNTGGWAAFAYGDVTASILAGDAVGDIIHLNPAWFFELQPQGLFADVSNWDYTTTPANQWNQSMMEVSRIDGVQYGFTLGHFTGGGIVFNQRLFQEAGLDPHLPFDLVDRGEWTWDTFLEIAHELTRDPENVGYPTTFGLATFGQDFLNRAVFSNGAQYVGRDASGLYYNATNTPEFMEAVSFTYNLQHEGIMMPQPEDSDWNWFEAAFLDGHAAMQSVGHYRWGAIMENLEDPWGFVPFPMGPRANNHYTWGILNISIIPHYFTPEEIDDLMFAYTLWTTVPEDFRGDDVWTSDVRVNHYDERSIDYIARYTRNAALQVFPFQYAIPGINMGPDITWHVWGYEPAQLVERFQARWNSHINVANGGEATYIPEEPTDYGTDEDTDTD